MTTPAADRDDDTPAHPATRDRPSRLVDIAVALLLLVADAVIVVVAVILFLVVGLGTAPSPHSPPTARSDVPFLLWLVVWGFPAVAATSAVVHARLRMPVTAVVQGLFTLACVFLAVVWTRMLLA